MTKLNKVHIQQTLAAALSLVFSVTAFSQLTDVRFVAEEDYSFDETFFKLPAGRTIGATSGLAIHPDGSSIWVYDRCGGADCSACW